MTYTGRLKREMTISRPVIHNFHNLNVNHIQAPPIAASKSYNLLSVEPGATSREPFISRATSNISAIVSSLRTVTLRASTSYTDILPRSGSSEFDVLYYYGDRSKDDIVVPKIESHLNTQIERELASLPSMHHVALIPLTFAQARRDIRTRNEGFEMKGDLDTLQVLAPALPASRSHANLISLRAAQAREDIRYRREAFEVGAGEQQSAHSGDLVCQQATADSTIPGPTSQLEDVPSVPCIFTITTSPPDCFESTIPTQASISPSSTCSRYSCAIGHWTTDPALQASPESARSLFGVLDRCGIPPIPTPTPIPLPVPITGSDSIVISKMIPRSASSISVRTPGRVEW